MLRRRAVAALVVTGMLGGCDSSTASDETTTTASVTPTSAAAESSAGMPLGEIGIRAEDGESHDYRIDQDALIQILVLAVSGGLPASKLPSGTGYHVDAAPEGSVLQLAGLQAGDEVTAINGMPLTGAESLQRAYTLLRSSRALVVSVIREGRPLAFHYEVSRNALSRRDRLPSRRSSRGIRPRMKLETLKDDIREVAEHTYEVAPSIVEELKEGSALMRSARMLPHSRDGKLVGIKLFGIRRSSVLGALGFKNGDTITAINGQPVTSPDRMLEIFGKLAPEPGKEATVEVTRRGRPITLRYRVRKRPSAARFVRPSALPPTVPSSLPPQLLQP